MRLVGKNIISDCQAKYPDSRKPLDVWVRMMEQVSFKNPAQLKAMLGSASIVPPYTVFNVAGNKYRVAALIQYEVQLVMVKFAGTHKEYDKEKWKKK